MSGGLQSKMGRVSVRETRGTKIFTPYTVGTPAVRVAPLNARRSSFFVVNNSQVVVYLGDADVTIANGLPVAAAANFEDLQSYDEWWAVTAGPQADLRICIVEVA